MRGLGVVCALLALGLSGCPYDWFDLGDVEWEKEPKLPLLPPPPDGAALASDVFPPDNIEKWFALDLPGTAGKTPYGRKTSVIEIRGWLRNIDGCNGADPDWHWDIEPDPEWLDEIGVPLNAIIRVGNIVQIAADQTDNGTFYRSAATPLIHLELNGLTKERMAGKPAPEGWGFVGEADCAGATWPYNPHNPIPGQAPLAVGQYVRAVGSIVSDQPHYSSAIFWTVLDRNFRLALWPGSDENAAAECWGVPIAESNPTNPARWTEMHPPDVIEVLPDKTRNETLRAIALAAEHGPLHGSSNVIDEDIKPPGPPPSATASVGYVELVGKETIASSLSEGSGAGAAVTVASDHIHVHVRVTGEGGYGAPGKFKAIYRVFWKD